MKGIPNSSSLGTAGQKGGMLKPLAIKISLRALALRITNAKCTENMAFQAQKPQHLEL